MELKLNLLELNLWNWTYEADLMELNSLELKSFELKSLELIMNLYKRNCTFFNQIADGK